MVVSFQTYSPDSCECVIEQQYDDEIDPPKVELAFFHTVCAKHKPLVKEISSNDHEKKAQKIMDSLELALQTNRDRNLKSYDEHPFVVERQNIIKNLKLSKNEKHGLLLESQADAERGNIVKGLDSHETTATLKLLNGLHSPDTFGTEDVYATILEEQRKKNSGG